VESTLTIRATGPPLGARVPDDAAGPEVARVDGAVIQMTVQILLQLTKVQEVENLTLALKVPSCFVLPEKSVHFPKVTGGRTPLVLPVTFRVSTEHLASRTDIFVAACYFVKGEARTATCQFRLPFYLLARVIPPVKSSSFKISLDATKMPSSLTDLFRDFLVQPHVPPSVAQSLTNTLSIQYFAGGEATVQFAKSMGRFWVQSSEFASLWPLSQEVCEKFTLFFTDEVNDPQVLSYQDSLPLHDYFSLLDDHFGLRTHLQTLGTDLADRARQFRIIQKRLLVRFRDRNPTLVDNLESLLRMSFDQVNQIADQIDEAQRALGMVGSHLSAATELIVLLIKYRFDMDDMNTDVLRQHFSSLLEDNRESGWEEQTDAALQHLLRTCLARSAKERSTIVSPMKMPRDTIRLKKRITSVIDRLAGGARLLTEQELSSGDEAELEEPDEDA
jgi:Bardet-Biedl syndrome 9 protein